MQKKNILIASTFILLMVFSAFVYAEGSSANSQSSDDLPSPPTLPTISAELQARIAAAKAECEAIAGNDREAIEERIKCRLEIAKEFRDELRQRSDDSGEDEDDYSREHESCRNLDSEKRERCRQLYTESHSCYDERGAAKDRCFKLRAGVATSSVSGQGINKEAARKLLVLYLYELEQRIENKTDAGLISTNASAELIADIVVIKEKIMSGAPGSEIRPLIRELKHDWKLAFRTQTNVDTEDDSDDDSASETDDSGEDSASDTDDSDEDNPQ